MIVSHARLCVLYVIKEVASFPGARSINRHGVYKNACLIYRLARKLQIGCKTANNCFI